jgi:1-deoxy-D-xylulose-5-phosphate synthase
VGYHAINKIEANPDSSTKKPSPPKYQDVFGRWLCDTAATDNRLIGITPAMCEGSGMVQFSQEYPSRYHDVAIAEQHAVTLAAGMACDGLKPVVAIYSTFLQRAYDQLIHDVALQNLDVTFAIDRGGLVGQDGATHHGVYDLSYLRCIPNMIIACPSNENECRQLLHTAYQHDGPAAVRYPRGAGTGALIEEEMTALPIGEAVTLRTGHNVAILNFGVLLEEAEAAARVLKATLIDMRWAKPLDETLLLQVARSHDRLITVEENALAGGAGSAVAEFLSGANIEIEIRHIAIPDAFIHHGSQTENRRAAGLTCDDIVKAGTLTAASAEALTNIV